MQLYSTPFALLALVLVLLLGSAKPAHASSSKYMARIDPHQHAAKRMIKLAARTDTAANEEFARKTLSGLGEIHRGQATWFEPDVNYCGGTSSTSSDTIVAASAKLFKKWGGGTKSKLCGQRIVLTARGKAVNATIQDECPECAEGSIDMSPAVFKQLAGLGVGVLGDLQWAFAKSTSHAQDDE